MDDPQNPIDRLIARFQRAADFEVKHVRGVVERVDTLEEASRKIYAVHIANGSLRDSFWLAHNHADPYFYPPRAGDYVTGTINTFDDSVAFADEVHKPVFDFKNLSGDEERAAFAWFAQNGERVAREAEQRRQQQAQAQTQPQLDDKARGTLYRKLGLRFNQ